MEQADLVIIGAGINGLTSASTYHRLNPDAKILILDSAPCIGGPWASHRIFPGLRSNNLLGMYEHPDFPMDEQKFGLKKGEHIPAEKLLKYLEVLVEESGIKPCLRLHTKVQSVKKTEEGWTLSCTSVATGSALQITASKLVIAIGTSNKSYMPKYPTSPAFEPQIFHSKDFPAQFSQIVKPSNHTLVIGGGKSAWDVSYACAKQSNATVTLLIRPSGNGPNWMAPSHVTPLTLWLEKLVFTRFFGFMSPCPWAQTSGIEGWLRSFFHGTWLGRKVVGAFWKILGDDAIALNKLHEHPETKKLVPWRGAFEVGNCLSIHNYPTNFFELVREGRIKVLIDEVQSFEAGKEVLLKSGQKLQVDSVLCATGWEISNSIQFEPGVENKIGLPTTQPPNAEEASLIEKSEKYLTSQYPCLNRDTSRVYHPDPALRYTQNLNTKQQPFRLYRLTVPPAFLKDRSIAFIGAIHCLGAFPLAYIQSLWITAYLDDKLALPTASEQEIREEIYKHTQYFVLRSAQGYGRHVPDMVFDSLPYFDLLLRDLGLEARRKGGAMRECYASYGPEDYRGLIDEWLQGGSGEGKKDV